MKKRLLRVGCASVAAVFSALPAFAGITWYAVDPLAEVRYMPNAAPEDGDKGGEVRFVAAKGEYEPASFVLVSDEDLGKVQLEVGDLKQVEGGRLKVGGAVFPKDKLDLRMVKVWYQSGAAWFSYFQDKKMKLCPELLLHDEDLVKVDEKKGWNYARLTEKDGSVSYRWLNPPGEVDTRLEDVGNTGWPYYASDSFLSMKENFSDSATFKGLALPKGVHKQVWITAHVTPDVPAGAYRGEVRVVARTASGRQQGNPTIQQSNNPTILTIPLVLRVLDFELPEPCTYLDCNRRFYARFCEYVSLDHVLGANGNDRPLAERQFRAILRDFAEHGVRLPSYQGSFDAPVYGQESGLDFAHPLYEAGLMELGEKVEMRYRARHFKEIVTRRIGWHNPVLGFSDEYGLRTLLGIRDMVKTYDEEGFRFLNNSLAGYEGGYYMARVWRPPYWPDGTSFNKAFKVSRLDDVDLGWYASQHVGPENPALCRRQYGFGPYRACFTFDGNYAQHIHGWNDLAGTPYRPMMFVYGTGNGCVDTIQWEGFREGLDDIRYATLLQRLAHPLVKSGSTEARYAAKKALGLLANADGDDMDLTTLRLEMIRCIEEMRKFKSK